MDKRHILGEIKRVTEANAGVPPGIARFLRETGIRIIEIERHWPRWGDALREAGYAPNKMQGAYSDETIFEKLAALARELGKFPTYREMTVKARKDSTFPWGKTLQRLGTKQQRAAKLEAYCRARPGYDDVASLCAPISLNEPGVDQNVEATAGDQNVGFVYLSKSGRYYKIGRSNAAGRREYEIALQMPEKYVTVHTIRTDDPVGIERYWHQRFEDRRKNGEWFDLSSDDVRAFKRRKFM